jgi:glycosyltransferase involved in cell wall biosynthesis
VRRVLGRSRRAVRAGAGRVAAWRRAREIARSEPAQGRIAVSYGRDRIPPFDEASHGGLVKLQELARVFANEPRAFNVLYLVSSTCPPDARRLIALSRRRGAAVVWNQDGVAYSAWHGPGWERVNEPLAEALHAADHVVFQSEFCKVASDRYLGVREGPSEILHNPVDIARFRPGERQERPPTVLLAGNQYQRYRFERALETLRLLPPAWRLVVTGALSWQPDRRAAAREAAEVLAATGLADRVELTGTYTQAEAPERLRRGDVLLHPKVNDPCPTAVLEAMACGLPVVYSATGGTPELVGEAGIGIPGPLDWERDHPPDPTALAEAVLAVHERLDELSAAARARAESFDVRKWLGRHTELFQRLAAT